MKNFGKLFLLGCLAMGLVACNNEEGPAQSESSNEAVYLQFKLEMPTATRSKTDEVGYPSDADADNEEGTAKESAITSLQLVLVDGESNVIAVSEPTLNPAGVGMYVAPFQAADLAAFADDNLQKAYSIYAYCNTTTSLVKGDKFVGDEVLANVDATWADGKFIMSNAKKVEAMMPVKKDVLKHNSADYPLVIGTVEVERVAARFDFAKEYNTFKMDGGIKIVLKEMGMFNIADKAYTFRHVSADGKFAGSELCGKETPNNYVVDVEGHGLTATAAPEWKSIEGLSVADQWVDNMNGEPKPEYYRFAYGVENAFAAGEKQTDAFATGIAFKGNILIDETAPEVDPDLKATFKAHTASIYVFNNVLLGDWARVKKLATAPEADAVLAGAYEAAAKLIAADKVTEGQDAKEVKAAKAAGFKAYTPSEQGTYDVYYNYFNRHNDNLNPKESGKMEFAVVRNNVYKLKVNNITKFGAAEWQKPDPEHPDPIEKDEIFFQVTVKILPWTVRVNNIEF